MELVSFQTYCDSAIPSSGTSTCSYKESIVRHIVLHHALRIASLLLALTAWSEAQAQTIVYVKLNPTTAWPAGDGLSWAEAYSDLSSCLHDIEPGLAYIVRVAAGTYRPSAALGEPRPSFRIRDGVTIEGGYQGVGTDLDGGLRDPDTYVTILTGELTFDALAECTAPPSGCDCQSLTPCEWCDCLDAHAEPGCGGVGCCTLVCDFLPDCCVVAWDEPCVAQVIPLCGSDPTLGDVRSVSVVTTLGAGEARRLDGVTVKGGGERPDPGATTLGGGIAIAVDPDLPLDPVALLVVRSRIVDNRAGKGGGIAIHTPNTCPGDPEDPPLATAFAQLWNCEIVENGAKSYGGGVLASDQSRYEIVNTVIARNGYIVGSLVEARAGGALHDTVYRPDLERWIVNCTITGN